MSAQTPTGSTAEDNVALGKHFFAEQDRLHGGPPAEICDDRYTVMIGSNPPMDRAGHDAFAVGFYAGFPDVYHDTDEAFGTDDRAFVRTILRGTHTGNFFGIPATGNPIAVAIHAVFHIADGKVQSLVATFDVAGLLRQIGVLPVG